MSRQFSETAPGGVVSGRKAVRQQTQGLVIEYVVESTAEEAVSVHLSDRLPTGRADDFGFHQDHGPEEWSLAEGDLEMTVTLDPGAERRVVVGLVAEGDELTDDQGEPTVDVEVRDAATTEPATTDGVSGGDVGEGEADADDAADGDADDEADGDDADADEANDGGFFDREGASVDDEGAAGDGDTIDPGEADEQPTPSGGERPRFDADGGVVDSGGRPAEGVVSTLVDELEAGTVSESELATLREHLAADRPESEAVKLEYVQKRLGDFDAYVDALEELLSVHGSGEDAITEIEGRLEAFGEDVEAVRRRQDDLAGRVDDLAATIETHGESVESLQVAHEEDVDAVRSELAELETDVETFEAIRRSLVDGLQRSEDVAVDAASGGATAGDADPDAADEVEEGHDEVVEGRDDDSSGSSDAGPVGEQVDEPFDDSAVADGERDVEESLEAVAASNVSGSGTTRDDEAAVGAGSTEDDPAPVLSLERGSDDGGSRDGSVEEWTDDGQADDGRVDDGFVSPVREGEARNEDADNEDADGSAEGEDDHRADVEIPRVDAEDADEEGDGDRMTEAADDAGDADDRSDDPPDAAGDDPDGDAGDDGRASSIFEIGDVDSEGSDAEEKPTIDFEDG